MSCSTFPTPSCSIPSSYPITNECPITGESRCRCANRLQQGGLLPPTTRDTLRKLYTDQATYLKCYIQGGGNIDPQQKKALEERLQENQKDISEYLKPFIGQENANKLNRALKEHSQSITSFIDSIKNKLDIEKGKQQLSQTTQQLSQYLSSLYPGQPSSSESIKSELEKQNESIANMTQNLVNKDYAKETKTYDAYYNNMLKFSDQLSQAPKVQQLGGNNNQLTNQSTGQSRGQIGSQCGSISNESSGQPGKTAHSQRLEQSSQLGGQSLQSGHSGQVEQLDYAGNSELSKNLGRLTGQDQHSGQLTTGQHGQSSQSKLNQLNSKIDEYKIKQNNNNNNIASTKDQLQTHQNGGINNLDKSSSSQFNQQQLNQQLQMEQNFKQSEQYHKQAHQLHQQSYLQTPQTQIIHQKAQQHQQKANQYYRQAENFSKLAKQDSKHYKKAHEYYEKSNQHHQQAHQYHQQAYQLAPQSKQQFEQGEQLHQQALLLTQQAEKNYHSVNPSINTQQGGMTNPDFEGEKSDYTRYLKYKAKYQALKNNKK